MGFSLAPATYRGTWLASVCLAALVLQPRAAAAGTRATPFVGETIFGDSLSDGGDYSILSDLGYIARFTTNPGLTASEYVGLGFGLATKASLLGGTNYAVGGAGVLTNSPNTASYVPTITSQITSYLAANPSLAGNELYWVEGGANDVFYHTTAWAAGEYAETSGLSAALLAKIEGVAAVETAAQAEVAIDAAGTQEADLVKELQAAGAKAIVVVNVPDTGRTIAAAEGETLVSGTEAESSELASAYDAALNEGLASASSGIIAVNLYALFNELLADPAAYGITNTTQTACTTSSSLTCTSSTLATSTAASTYLFADGVHPTTAVQKMIAEVVIAEIVAPQLVSLLAEQPLAALDQERDTVFGQLLSEQSNTRTGVHLFASSSAVSQRIAGQSYLPTAHAVTGTMTIGVIDTLPHGFSVGFEMTGGVGHQHTSGAPIGFDTNMVGGTLFGQYAAPRGFYAAALIGADQLDFSSIKRQFAIGSATRVETGNTQGTAFQTALTTGWWFGGKTLKVSPFVSIAYDDAAVHRYAEQGDDAVTMWFGSQRRQSLLGTAGARFAADVKLRGIRLRPYAELAYVQDFLAQTSEVEAGLVTLNGRFSMPGFTGDRHWAEGQAGVSASLTRRLNLQVGYLGRFAARTTNNNGGNIGLDYAF